MDPSYRPSRRTMIVARVVWIALAIGLIAYCLAQLISGDPLDGVSRRGIPLSVLYPLGVVSGITMIVMAIVIRPRR